MPNAIGGDQYDEEYAPHLYYKGKFVGEKKADQLKARDEKNRKDEIRGMLDKVGLRDFNYEARGYTITDQDPWSIDKEGVVLGSLHGKGYVNIIYQIGLSPDEPTILRQVDLAGELAAELRKQGCDQLIELPPRNVVIAKLEEIILYSRKLVKKLKRE